MKRKLIPHDPGDSRLFVVMLLLIWASPVFAQSPDTLTNVHWEPQESGMTVSFRGVSAVDEEVAWVSGNDGRYARTLDGGKTWMAGLVPGADSLDFRDIEAIDANTAYLLSVGPETRSRIYKTVDGGNNWQLQFVNEHPEGFLNGMAFWDAAAGIAVSDPVGGRLLVITTTDGGESWNRVPPENLPATLDGEYGFAASGTGLTVYGRDHVWIGTGGAAARVFRSADQGRTWTVTDTPVISGRQSTGIFSLVFRDANNGIAVGGDYRRPTQTTNCVARTADGGKTWALIRHAESVPFRSCVRFIPGTTKRILVAVGTSGSDISFDDGLTWTNIARVGYHTISFAESFQAGWAAGAEGRIAKFVATAGEP